MKWYKVEGLNYNGRPFIKKIPVGGKKYVLLVMITNYLRWRQNARMPVKTLRAAGAAMVNWFVLFTAFHITSPQVAAARGRAIILKRML